MKPKWYLHLFINLKYHSRRICLKISPPIWHVHCLCIASESRIQNVLINNKNSVLLKVHYFFLFASHEVYLYNGRVDAYSIVVVSSEDSSLCRQQTAQHLTRCWNRTKIPPDVELLQICQHKHGSCEKCSRGASTGVDSESNSSSFAPH